MSDKLSPKQEKFCQNIAVKGMNQADAYRDAYNAKNMKDDTIYSKSSALAAQGKVKARIKALTDRVVDKQIFTREQWAEQAEEIRQLALTPDDDGKLNLHVALKAIREKADAAGLPVQKVTFTGINKADAEDLENDIIGATRKTPSGN